LILHPVTAALVTAAFAALAYGLGMVSRGGAFGGLLVGTIVYACLGPQGFTVLALFVVVGSLLTRLGYGSKRRAGTAEAGGGRRGAKNALANCGVAVVCALLYALAPSDALAAAFVASLGAAFADTAESEVGGLYGRAPRLITSLREVPPGTDGAVSAAGTLAGLAAAGLTAVFGLALGLVASPGATVVVAFAALFGTVADSLAGALAPRLGNEITNLLCTLVAAALTLFLI
jgi:uncharacterized protein (TIGR00297 family)